MKLVVLDRDGTINEDREDFVKSAEEWQALPGAIAAIARLVHAGWRVVVATNQSGLARGQFDMHTLNAMHAKLHKLLALQGARVDAIFYCPHLPEDACNCRKPQSGLFEQIRDRFHVDMRQVPTVGDSLRDLQAGARLGCPTHLVLTGKGAVHRGRPLPDSFPAGTQVHEDLPAFADYLLAQTAAVAASGAPGAGA